MAIQTVLVVDDSPTDLHLLSEMLTRNGFEVMTASTGQEAIDIAQGDAAPDAILMDIVMPDMNGFEATRAIARGPKTSHIPIIVVSTKGLETDKLWGLRQGAKEYLVKPINEAELVQRLRAL